MTADKPLPLVPKLRFPEFRNAPEWEERKLGDVSEVLMCKRIFASQTNPNGGVPFYKIGTLGEEPDAFISKDLFEEYKSKYNFPRPSEILITCSGTVGKCLAYDGSEAYFQDSNIVWIDNPTLEVSNEFLLSILSNVNWSTLNSTTITRIYGPDLRGLAIKFPQEEQEQKRIADCLGSLDDLIAAEDRKLEALRQHKQGLMQQLFPQPGETVPRLRFPEFADAPHWQTSTFGERCESFSGSTPDTSNRAYYGGTIPFIRSAEIGRDETEIFLTEEGLANSAAKMVKRGDLLVALYGANSGDTALARIDGAINQAIMCLHSRDSAPYLYHYLTARKNWIIATYLQGGQGNLSGQIVLSVPLSVPHRDEQEKVADCLSSLDARIEEQAQRIDALRRHKQGLLQQLFP